MEVKKSKCSQGSPAGTDDVNDLSDDGNDNDGNTESDPTVIFISSPPKLKLLK